LVSALSRVAATDDSPAFMVFHWITCNANAAMFRLFLLLGTAACKIKIEKPSTLGYKQQGERVP